MKNVIFVIFTLSIISISQMFCSSTSHIQKTNKDTDQRINKSTDTQTCHKACEKAFLKCLDNANGIPDKLKACDVTYKRCIHKCEDESN